ncbi:TetR family transcriptional regulator [Brevibacterium sp. FAM 27836]|uniref:TetR family transcriptional regulator n=1 Tax=Brevibacterium sp. FAM 27836 TaxID=3446693 RepID=UPI003F519D1D
MTEPTQIEGTDSTRLRSDAALNRRRILDAAAELFAQRGLDVPMSAIARRAGVGVATVFRRFPDRSSLVRETFDTQLDHCEAVLAEAVADPDPWRGFRRFLEEICRMQIDDRGFTDAFLSTRAAADDRSTRGAGDRIGERRRQAEVELSLLVERAQQAGMLRADFTVSDLTMVMLANSGVGTASGDHAHELSRRLVAFLLIAFGTEAARARISLPPPSRMGIGDLYTGEG